MRTIIAEKGQSVFDLAVQGYGSIVGVFWLLEDNGWQALDRDIAPGTEVKFRDEIIDEAVYKEIKEQGLRPMTMADRETPIAFSSGFSKGFR